MFFLCGTAVGTNFVEWHAQKYIDMNFINYKSDANPNLSNVFMGLYYNAFQHVMIIPFSLKPLYIDLAFLYLPQTLI